jgi:hypothetical protein
MQRRSQTKLQNIKPVYEVNIDFDGASEAWRSNKKYVGNGCYKYVCIETTKKGKKCDKCVLTGTSYCKMHSHNKLKILV